MKLTPKQAKRVATLVENAARVSAHLWDHENPATQADVIEAREILWDTAEALSAFAAVHFRESSEKQA